MRGGVRFVAAYPITPATELLEWMAPALTECGGTLVQAEDELASVNMAIGAGYAGVPALTATAGPGLSLDVRGDRPGGGSRNSAGGGRRDARRAIDRHPGEVRAERPEHRGARQPRRRAPRIVLAPSTVADCAATTQWAVELAEALQVPALVLSDQFLGQTRAIVDPLLAAVSSPMRRVP